MQLLKQRFTWKLRKVLRYIRLYGLGRTRAKVRAHYHMERTYAELPVADPAIPLGHVGLIGCGKFAYSGIAYYLRRNYGKVIRACMDTDLQRAASLADSFDIPYYTDDAEQLLDDERIDLVFIASNHASHARYAIKALERGKAVHIEKPHCVTEDQLDDLCRALRKTNGKVALGFNRPLSRFGRLILQHLTSESGPAMLNWFIAGHQIDSDHWYFHEREGGRILGNLCHWTDFVYQLVPPEGRFPIVITPTRAKKADSDIAVTYLFGDGSIAAITFSAKGHTFEGVRERFAAHKGNVLISLDDFKALTIEVVERKHRHVSLYRDHGHEERIRKSYSMVSRNTSGEVVPYVWETGMLFLKTREALERRQQVTLDGFADLARI